MSGLEAAGLALGVVGLVIQAFDAAVRAVKLVEGVKEHLERYKLVWSSFENQRMHFYNWGHQVGLLRENDVPWDPTDPTPEIMLRQKYGEKVVERIKETLEGIKGLLEEAERVHNKYGLVRVKTGNKIAWVLSREDEFKKLVEHFRNYVKDLQAFTDTRRNHNITLQEAPRALALPASDISPVKIMRHAAHDFNDTLEGSLHFSSPDISLLLKLQQDRFQIEETHSLCPEEPLPEWLDLQLDYRPGTIKFLVTMIPPEYEEPEMPVVVELKKTAARTSRSTTPESTSSIASSMYGVRQFQSQYKLLFESMSSKDGRSASSQSLRHIARGLNMLDTAAANRACTHCNAVAGHVCNLGFCLGGFSGLSAEMNHIVYQIPYRPKPSQQMVSLDDLLPGGRFAHVLKKTPIPKKRMQLVHLVALSFMQLYDTRWFPADLSCKDIVYSVLTDGSLRPSINKPYVRRRTTALSKPNPDCDLDTQSHQPPPTPSSVFDDAAFHLGLVIYQILVWPSSQEARSALVTEAKSRRTAALLSLPAYSATANHEPAANTAANFEHWVDVRLLRQVAQVVCGVRARHYLKAVRLCLLGGFGKLAASRMAARRSYEDGSEVEAILEVFWEKVVQMVRLEVG